MKMLQPDTGPPVDRYNVCYFLLFFLSLATLLPWNAFISSSGYFLARLGGTSYSVNFENYFGVTYNVTNMLSLALLTYTPLGGFSARIKVLYPFIVVFFAFILQTVACLIPPTKLDGNSFFAMTVALVTVCGGCNALIQAGLFGLAARLPTTYVQGLMAGQGMGGLLPASLVVLTVAVSPPTDGTPTYEDVKWSAFSFFAIASLTAFLAIVGYVCLERLPILEHFGALDLVSTHQQQEHQFLDSGVSSCNPSNEYHKILQISASEEVGGGEVTAGNGNNHNYCNEHEEDYRDRLNDDELKKSLSPSVNKNRGRVSISTTTMDNVVLNRSRSGRSEVGVPLCRAASTRTYIDISPLAWGVFINFSISLSVFPSVTANIYASQANAHQDGSQIKFNANPKEGRFYGDLFVPITCFLLFNFFDFIGSRSLAKYRAVPIGSLLPLSIARIVFVPLFLLCNVVQVGESMIPSIFTNVTYPICFMIGLAFTNGYLNTLQFMTAPSLVPDSLQDSAGRMMCFFCSAGLLAGSTLSFFLHYLLCTCNPATR
eukprot:jgi/Bigna1/90193/estExt_fgenesh1_pg.C_650002